jgi:hypothetical protein
MITKIEHDTVKTLLAAKHDQFIAEPDETDEEFASRYLLSLVNKKHEIADLKERRGKIVPTQGTATIVSEVR